MAACALQCRLLFPCIAFICKEHGAQPTVVALAMALDNPRSTLDGDVWLLYSTHGSSCWLGSHGSCSDLVWQEATAEALGTAPLRVHLSIRSREWRGAAFTIGSS